MATAKKKPVVVRKKKKAVAPKIIPVDLSGCRLEVHPYPKNCGACVLAEFGGGHSKLYDIVGRALTWDEWKHVLYVSLFVQKSGGGGLGLSNVLNFSERKDQAARANFSGLALFNMLTQQGCTGNITVDSRYKFYSVVLTDGVRKEICDTKNLATPKTVSKGVTFDPRWGAWIGYPPTAEEAGDVVDEEVYEDEDDNDF